MKRFGSESGQTLIFVALSMTVLLGFVGFATDVGVLLHEKREAQTAADSAAIAGANEALEEGNPSTITTNITQAAKIDAALNGFTDGSNGATVTVSMAPDITVSTFNSSGYVQATVTQDTPDFFMSLFGKKSMSVSATAVASVRAGADGCGYVNNPDGKADPAIYMSGNSLIAGGTCGIYVNGNIGFNGNKATINAGYVGATGTIPSGNINAVSASGIPPQPDPFAGTLSNPANELSASTCNTTTNCFYDYKGGNLTGPLQLNSGIYYFDVPVSISGQITEQGGGVMFYLAGTIPFSFAANGSVSLTPLTTTGTYANILIDAPNDGPYTTCKSGKGNNGNAGQLYFDFGSSNTTLNGIIYAPAAQLFTQDSGATLKLNIDLVIGNICSQSATFSINGLTGGGGGGGIAREGLVY